MDIFLKKKSIAPGVVIITVALLLFVFAVYNTVSFPPTGVLQFIILILTVLGVNFGVSSGKKLAYTIHDRDILLKQTEGRGQAASAIGGFMKVSIVFASLTVILWSLFIITLSLSWSVLGDKMFLGEVRWLMIFSMIILIYGSYLFYRSKSYDTSHMLTFTGKKLLRRGSGVMKKAMNTMSDIEEKGIDAVKKTWRNL